MPTTYGVSTYGVGVYEAIAVVSLFPGTNVYPDTTQYPGQGDIPFIRCLISLDNFSAPVKSWADYSNRLRSWSVNRGRPNELGRFDAGTAEVVLNDRDRAVDPLVQSGIGPMNQVRLYAELDAQIHELYYGYVESVAMTWPDGGWSDALATFRCADENKVLSRLANVALSAPSEPTGTRIGRLLDLVGSHAPRALDVGGIQMAARSGDFNLVSEVQLARDTEHAAAATEGADFFFAKNGAATFYGQSHRIGLGAIKAVFTDTGVGVSYLDAELDYSDSFLANVANVEDTTGVAGFSFDAPSVARHGERVAEPDPVTVSAFGASTPMLNAFAANTVSAYKNPLVRVTSLDVNTGDLGTLEAALTFDLLDRLWVTRTPPGGGAAISSVAYIQSLSWSGVPGGPPSLRLGVSPL